MSELTMRVTKVLRFEAAHRIPWHEGECRHLHGHSYEVEVSLNGPPDERGMVIDFKHIKAMIAEMIDLFDHSVIAAEDDVDLIRAVEGLGGKLALLPYDSTAENLCRYIGTRLLMEAADVLREHRIERLEVGVRETATSTARATFAPAGEG